MPTDTSKQSTKDVQPQTVTEGVQPLTTIQGAQPNTTASPTPKPLSENPTTTLEIPLNNSTGIDVPGKILHTNNGTYSAVPVTPLSNNGTMGIPTTGSPGESTKQKVLNNFFIALFDGT